MKVVKNLGSGCFVAAIFIILIAAVGGSTQYSDTFGGIWNNPSSATAGMMVQQWIQRKELEKMMANRRKTAAPSPTAPSKVDVSARVANPPSKATIDAAVTFRPAGTLFKTKDIADALGRTPEERNNMLQLLKTLYSGYQEAATSSGYANDIAMAFAVSLASNSSIYNASPAPSDARIAEIRNALAELMTTNKTFEAVNDRHKQEIYEVLVTLTMLAKYGYERSVSAGDQKGVAFYRSLAGTILKQVSGMPPEEVTL